MRLTCPACGAVSSAEAWTNDADARACLKIVSEMPWGIPRICLSYLALFRPASGKGLSWSKALTLLTGLKGLIEFPHIQWEHRVARPNVPEAWVKAIERVADHPPKTLPLKNHNYLRAVVYEIADDMDKQQEKRDIEAERTGRKVYYRNPLQNRTGSESEPSRISFEEMRRISEENYRKHKKEANGEVKP
jgi:hypothetical protein